MPRAPPGVYTEFEDFVRHLTDAQLKLTRAEHPALPPSTLPQCQCGLMHTLAEQMETEGAIHGDRILGRVLIARHEPGTPTLPCSLYGCRRHLQLCTHSSHACMSVCLQVCIVAGAWRARWCLAEAAARKVVVQCCIQLGCEILICAMQRARVQKMHARASGMLSSSSMTMKARRGCVACALVCLHGYSCLVPSASERPVLIPQPAQKHGCAAAAAVLRMQTLHRAGNQQLPSQHT